MGPTLKEEALDNHSTVSRVGKQKYSTEKKKPSRRKRLSDLFPFQEVTGKEATRDQKKRKKRKKGGRNAFYGSFMFKKYGSCFCSTSFRSGWLDRRDVISKLSEHRLQGWSNLVLLDLVPSRVRCSFK